MILKVNNLSTHFHLPDGGLVRAVDGVSFSLESGKTLALVGQTGSGKSQTALSIMQLTAKNAVHSPDSEIRFEEQNLLGQSEAKLQKIRGSQVAMIFQDPVASLNPLYRVGSQLIEPLRLHKGLSKPAAKQRALELLDEVGIDQPELRQNSYPFELSGGMAQRVMIALALICKPKLLIADEPTTSLDVTIQAQILKLLQKLQQETGTAILFITHDLGVVYQIADTVCVMQSGKIVETNDRATLFSHPQHDYTKQLLSSIPSTKDKVVPSFADPLFLDNAPLLEVKNLKTYFPVKRGILLKTVAHIKAVDEISFKLRQGETLALVGESGSGKTTTGHSILGLLKEAKGEIIFKGQNILKMPRQELNTLRKNFQVIFQNPYAALSPRLTAGEIVEEGLSVHYPKLSRKEKRAKVINILEEVGLLPEDIHKYPHQFSGGQCQRIAIARALILKPELLVLDEPTSSIDVIVQAQVLKLLQKMQEQHNLTYLFITHDLGVVEAVADRVAVMFAGKIVEQGMVGEVLKSPQHEYTKTLLAAVPKIIKN